VKWKSVKVRASQYHKELSHQSKRGSTPLPPPTLLLWWGCVQTAKRSMEILDYWRGQDFVYKRRKLQEAAQLSSTKFSLEAAVVEALGADSPLPFP
jgi:hypothetical protein